MKKLMDILMLSCKKATLLIEKKSKSPLSGFKGFQLKMHLAICDKCKEYEQQSRLIDHVLNQQEGLSDITGLKLSDKSKDLIISILDKNRQKE